MGASAAVIIRDPVHGYVRVASHERKIIDHEITQRLRNVAQTGLAHMIYPEANTSRFVHSLGAMHLASRFLVSSIENANDKDVKAFFSELEPLVASGGSGVQLRNFDRLLVHERGHAGGGLLASRLAFRTHLSPAEMTRRRRLLVAAEGALRLAALFHDLGHLPFSHDLEYAFEAFAAENKGRVTGELQRLIDGPPHEVIGHELAVLLFDVLVRTERPEIRAMFWLAKEILRNKPPYDEMRNPNAGVTDWLHSLVDGEIDVDRGDYLLRDGRALGFEFAAYDLERLLDNVLLIRDTSSGFITAVHEAGLSALESYFLSRARSAQMMVRHHKNAQFGAALRHVSARIFERGHADELLRDLKTLMKWAAPASRQPAAKEKEKFLQRYSSYDDAWWTGLLRDFKPENRIERACCDLVLSRRAALKSVWKRRGELEQGQVRQLNAQIRGFFGNDADKVHWRQQRAKLLEKNVLTALHKFKPYRIRPGGDETESLVLVVTASRGAVPAARISPLIGSLANAWQEDVHMHTFALSESTVSKEEVLKLLGVGLSAEAKN